MDDRMKEHLFEDLEHMLRIEHKKTRMSPYRQKTMDNFLEEHSRYMQVLHHLKAHPAASATNKHLADVIDATALLLCAHGQWVAVSLYEMMQGSRRVRKCRRCAAPRRTRKK